MTDSGKEAWVVVGKIAAGVVLTPLSIASYVYAMSKMWEWFVTAQYSISVPPWWVIWGITVMANLMIRRGDKYNDDPNAEDRKRGIAERQLESICVAWIALGLAWLIKLYGPMIAG